MHKFVGILDNIGLGGLLWDPAGITYLWVGGVHVLFKGCTRKNNEKGCLSI